MTKSIFSDSYILFRKLLLNERIKAGLTQTEVGSRLGKPQSYVYKYEKGERRLDVIEFLDIADAIGFNPHNIIDKIYDGEE